jgi:MFS transporter, DHA1 family, tetracycline resistance protein
MSNKRSLAIIFLIIFVNLLGFGIIIPLLPFYADNVGATPLQIGLLFASYSLCQIVAAPFLGSLSDQHGRRPILLISLVGTVASFVLLALANSLFLLFVARIVDGLSGGNISTARAYISDITKEEDRARAYGIIGAAFGLGFIFGPALGGLLGRYSFSAPAWGAALLALIALILTWIWLPETKQRMVVRRSAWRDLPAMLSHPVLGRLLILDFAYWAAFAVYQTTFALFAKIRFDWGIVEVGYMLALVGFIGAVVQGGLVGIVVRRIGEKATLVLGLVLAAIGLGAAAFAYTWPFFVVTLIPAAIGSALSSPSLIALISQNSDQAEQGRVQGTSGALESLGRTVGPVWGNGFLGAFGESVAYLSAAAVLGILALWSSQFSLKKQVQPTDVAASPPAVPTPAHK